MLQTQTVGIIRFEKSDIFPSSWLRIAAAPEVRRLIAREGIHCHLHLDWRDKNKEKSVVLIKMRAHRLEYEIEYKKELKGKIKGRKKLKRHVIEKCKERVKLQMVLQE